MIGARGTAIATAALLALAAAPAVAVPKMAVPAAGGAQQGAPSPDAATHALSRADSILEAQARRLAAELRCPVCQGLSLEDSPAELAEEMKDLIRERLRAGDSPEDVKRYFVSRYGEWVLLKPRAKGFNVAVWALPVAGLLGGVAFVAWVVLRWTRRPAAVPTEIDESERARVRRELERLEAERD